MHCFPSISLVVDSDYFANKHSIYRLQRANNGLCIIISHSFEQFSWIERYLVFVSGIDVVLKYWKLNWNQFSSSIASWSFDIHACTTLKCFISNKLKNNSQDISQVHIQHWWWHLQDGKSGTRLYVAWLWYDQQKAYIGNISQ